MMIHDFNKGTRSGDVSQHGADLPLDVAFRRRHAKNRKAAIFLRLLCGTQLE